MTTPTLVDPVRRDAFRYQLWAGLVVELEAAERAAKVRSTKYPPEPFIDDGSHPRMSSTEFFEIVRSLHERVKDIPRSPGDPLHDLGVCLRAWLTLAPPKEETKK